MIKSSNFARKALCGGTALQALVLLGAGLTGSAIFATPAAAQDYTTIAAVGRVVGTNGEQIQGATVEVRSDAQGFVRTATTDGSGSFRVPQIPAGSYTITITATGFDTYTEAGVVLDLANASNEFTLSPTGSATATASGDDVVVIGRRQTVDFNRNTTGSVINLGELATRVPVARDITSVVLLSPGTLQGDNAFGNLPNIAGASVSENTYFINGLNITNFFTGLGGAPVPFDFYQTVEVKNGGIAAEFGRTSGGFINAVSKSGSNDFHGGVTFNWEPDSLSSKMKNTYATDNDSRYTDRKDFIAQLSGPIIKDHLFFYGLYQSRDVQSRVGSTGATSLLATAAVPAQYVPFPGIVSNTLGRTTANPAGSPTNTYLTGTQYIADRSRSPFYGGKIDAVIVDGQRLEFTYFNTSSLTTRDIFGTSLFPLAGGRYNPVTNDPGRYASTTLFRSGGENYVGRYTGQFTKWFTLSGGYGRNYITDTTESSTPNASSIIDARTGSSVQIGNPTANTTKNFGRREFYRADADIYVNLLGSHHFRGGYDRENLRAESSTLANGNYQIGYATGSAADARVPTAGLQYVTRRYFQNGGNFQTKGEAYYLQDSWALFDNRIQLNLGVRNDKFVNKNADGDTFFDSGSLWAPRLGFSADPFGNGRTKVYGSFSRYYLPVATNTNIRLAGPELDYTTYNVLTGVNADQTPILGAPIQISGGRACPAAALAADRTGGNNCTVNSDGTTPPFASLVDASLKAQSRDEYILGLEQRVGTRIRLGAYVTQRKLNESLEDAYIDQGVRGYCRREFANNAAKLASCFSIFSGFHQYSLLNPGSDVTVLLDGIIAGETTQRTATLTAADLGLPKAKAKYRSLTLTADRDFDGKWSASFSYTLSSLKGNIEGGVRSDNGQTDSGLTTAFDFPALVNGADGFLPPHRKHNIKVYGSYQLFDFLNIGANLQVTSPRKFGCIGTVPSTVDGTADQPAGFASQYGAAGFYCNVVGGQVQTTTNGFTAINDPLDRAGGPRATTLQLTPRGSVFESDWLYNLNVDVALKIPTDAFDGTLRLSVFNVLNRKAELDYNEVGTTAAGAPSTLYGQPTQYQSGRSARIQFGVNF